MSKPGLLALTPLASLVVERHLIPASTDGLTPNTSIQHKPLTIYRGALPAGATADAIEAHLRAVGVCAPMWRYTMYNMDHFHTTAHELLAVVHGRARANFGGDGCPAPLETELARGDVVFIPAGVSHRLLRDFEGDFALVGAYEVEAEHWDMCYGRKGEEEHLANIKKLGWPASDPIYGPGGPITST